VGRRCIGLDVRRELAPAAVWEDGVFRHLGQIALTDESLRIFADRLGPEDEIATEATCITRAIGRLLEPHVAQVMVSNTQKPRAIAKVPTQRLGADIRRRTGSPTKTPGRCAARSLTGAHSAPPHPLDNHVQSILHRNSGANHPALGQGSQAGALALPWRLVARATRARDPRSLGGMPLSG